MYFDDLDKPEVLRILRAARDEKLRINRAGRYTIDGEKKRPDRRLREKLLYAGLITWPSHDSYRTARVTKEDPVVPLLESGKRELAKLEK
jgi:hypothetical protein